VAESGQVELVVPLQEGHEAAGVGVASWACAERPKRRPAAQAREKTTVRFILYILILISEPTKGERVPREYDRGMRGKVTDAKMEGSETVAEPGCCMFWIRGGVAG
jgi:hypothetical protein